MNFTSGCIPPSRRGLFAITAHPVMVYSLHMLSSRTAHVNTCSHNIHHYLFSVLYSRFGTWVMMKVFEDGSTDLNLTQLSTRLLSQPAWFTKSLGTLRWSLTDILFSITSWYGSNTHTLFFNVRDSDTVLLSATKIRCLLFVYSSVKILSVCHEQLINIISLVSLQINSF